MPKLSPESEGAQRTSALPSSVQSASSESLPTAFTCSPTSGSGRKRETSSVEAPTTVSRAGTCSTSAEKAVSSTGRPLRSSARPRKRISSFSPGSLVCFGAAATSTPFGTIRYSPPNQRRPVHAAASETAIRAESWLNLRRAPPTVAIPFGNPFVE